jgi:hypothetical protein
MNAIGYHAPDGKIGCVGDLYWLIEGVFWNKVKRPISLRKPFDRKFSVQVDEDNGVMPGLPGSINHDDITITDSGVLHGVTGDSDIKCSRRVSNHEFIQVKRCLDIIVGWRGEAA